MLPHPWKNFKFSKLTNFQKSIIKANLNFMVFIQKNNFPIIKDGAYVINLDKFKSIGNHCIALYVNRNNLIYFDNFWD